MGNFRIFYTNKINFNYEIIKIKTNELLEAMGNPCKECNVKSCPFMYDENNCIKTNLLEFKSMIKEIEQTKYIIDK